MSKRELPKYNALGLPITWWGLADGNSFYCSCEVSQKPWLDGRPAIVASNSDKIAIALNRQARALGFKLGDLLFEKVNEIRQHRVLIWPSNYELYGNMSADMHTALASFVQDYDLTSIDEGFMDFTGYDHLDLYEYGREIIDTIRYGKWIPIALGIGPTKTLAKAANKLAKSAENDRKGFYMIGTEQERVKALKRLPLDDVWGVGRRFRDRIERDLGRGNLTAYDFATMYQKRVRKLLGVTGERTYLELNGIQCVGMEEAEPKDRIMTSRMLTPPLTEQDEILAALTHHLETSARKLRRQNSYAQSIFVFFMTSQHDKYRHPKLVRSLEMRFQSPVKTTGEMLPYLTQMVGAMWPRYRPGQERYRFNKCGVMLGEISSDSAKQPCFGDDVERSRKMETLQAVIDEINGDTPADKRRLWFGAEFAHKDKIKFKREGLTENPTAIWSQRHKISNG